MIYGVLCKRDSILINKSIEDVQKVY